jgi:GNAT superfamily N-acetyltransferase
LKGRACFHAKYARFPLEYHASAMVTYRKASLADNGALCDLERRTPLLLGESWIVFDRTEFFDQHDLQEDAVVWLAEEEGRVIGACAGAVHRAPLAGQERLLLYLHHERVDPACQRRGIGGALTTRIADHFRDRGLRPDVSYYYIAPGNAPSRAYAERSGARPWPLRAHHVLIPTALASEAGGAPRRVGAGPIFDIVRLINETHAGKDLFRPYEQVDFGQRLARSRHYGWGDVYGRYVDGRLVAVAGIWDRGATYASRLTPAEAAPGAEVVEGRGPRTPARAEPVEARAAPSGPSRSWVVADWGHGPGAETEMVALLAGLLPLARAAGRDSLVLHLDRSSALIDALSERLPGTVVDALFYAPRLSPPPAPAPLYVDPVLY